MGIRVKLTEGAILNLARLWQRHSKSTRRSIAVQLGCEEKV